MPVTADREGRREPSPAARVVTALLRKSDKALACIRAGHQQGEELMLIKDIERETQLPWGRPSRGSEPAHPIQAIVRRTSFTPVPAEG